MMAVFAKGLGNWVRQHWRWSAVRVCLRHLLGVGLLYRQRHARSRRQETDFDLLAWGRRILPEHFNRAPSQMHIWLGEQLSHLHKHRGTKLNVLGPRGGAKSTIGSLCYVLRVALEGWEPYIWIISDTSSQAQQHLENVKTELANNAQLAEAYPQASGVGSEWKKSSIKLNNGVRIECFGTGQKLRGRRFKKHRPTLIVCDDIENDAHIESPRRRDLSRRWFQTALINAGTHETNIINFATALHRDALAMQLCHTPGWESQIFSAIVRWPKNRELWQEWERIYTDSTRAVPTRDAWNFYQKNQRAMDEGAVVLWPEWETLYVLMQMRMQRGQAAFDREKQNSPTDPTRCEWPAEYFDEHIWFDHWPDELSIKVIALDPSKGGDGRHGDYSALVVLGIDARGTAYVEANLARRDTSQIVRDGVRLCREHQASMLGIEANQFQALLADDFMAEFVRQRIHWCMLCKLHNTVPKNMRIRRIGPWLSRRNMRFLRGCASTELLVNQLRDFPLGSHDDGPDALEMALRLVEEQRHKRLDDGLGNRLVVG
jgi:predicted phage terminase large subunit-like protein